MFQLMVETSGSQACLHADTARDSLMKKQCLCLAVSQLRALHGVHDPEKEAEKEEAYTRGMCMNACSVCVHVVVVYVIVNILVSALLKSKKKQRGWILALCYIYVMK